MGGGLMGARTFTDDEGNKFELVARNPWAIPEVLAIKPIKAVEKSIYRLLFWHADSDDDAVELEYDLTEPQAQKVAAYLEASLKAITTNDRRYFNGEVTECFKDAARAFREDA